MSFAWRYYCYITPLEGYRNYGDEIDISDRVDLSGIGKIKSSIDSANYQFGLYSFGDIQVKAYNKDGYFNESDDSRSIFKSSRDLAKIRVVISSSYVNSEGDQVTTEYPIFSGLINDEASKVDADDEIITFRVLSIDSIFNKVKVSAGLITNGTLASQALEQILGSLAIAQVLEVDGANINPLNDFALEDGSAFDDMKVKEAVEKLLQATNSVITITRILGVENVIIRSRDDNDTAIPLKLYGRSDIYGRENIVALNSYNNGKQRMFNSIIVNTYAEENSSYQLEFGVRQIEFEFLFITSEELARTIAASLLDTFKAPKLECRVTVPTRVMLGYEILDNVMVDFPLRIKPASGNFVPIIGSTAIGDTSEPLPFTYGSLMISPTIKWKIIEIVHDPKALTTELLLRQSGVELNDGGFEYASDSLIGFGLVGTATISF